MGGQSQVNKDQQAQAALARQQEHDDRMLALQPTAEQKRYEAGASSFSDWLGNKDYSKAPDSSSILNFDLWNPAHTQRQREQMAGVQGIGSANMGGTGDQSLALQLSKEHNANAVAEDAGQAWENAVHATDNYYKGGDMSWANLETQKRMGVLGNDTQREMGYNRSYVNTAPKPWTQTILPMLLGGAMSAGGAMLGRPGMGGGGSGGGGYSGGYDPNGGFGINPFGP